MRSYPSRGVIRAIRLLCVCALFAALGLGPPPPNDNCADRSPIFSGPTPFSTIGALTDGPSHGACLFFGFDQVDKDIWYNYTADCTGELTVSTCGSGYDTKLAVYSGCSCPVSDANLLACNDDACGVQSNVIIPVTSGECYKIRVGGFAAAEGSGTLGITCKAAPICLEPDANCQDFNTVSAANSTNFRCAETFVPSQNWFITEICWWGAYLPAPPANAFRVTIYKDSGGLPGALLCPQFVQPITLTVAGPVDTGLIVPGVGSIWEHKGTLDPGCFVEVGECYWVEIRNVSVSTTWLWVSSGEGDGKAIQDVTPADGYSSGSLLLATDLAFCLDLPLGHPSDINRDGAVNVLDLIDLLLCFGQPASPGCKDEDVNGDNTVNVLDLIDLLLAFGTVCP